MIRKSTISVDSHPYPARQRLTHSWLARRQSHPDGSAQIRRHGGGNPLKLLSLYPAKSEATHEGVVGAFDWAFADFLCGTNNWLARGGKDTPADRSWFNLGALSHSSAGAGGSSTGMELAQRN